MAVVTGAGRGIGRAIAIGFAAAGAGVACAARTQDEIDETARRIAAAGGRSIAVPVDVVDAGAVEALFARTAEELGGVDLVVINAGVDLARAPLAQSEPEAWRATLETNLLGAYHCARAAIPHLRARGGGKILTVGSGLGHRGIAGGSAYASSKAGLWMLVRVLAQELRGERISVNELIPGPVDTAMSARVPDERFEGDWRKSPEDVVPLALFLALQPDDGPTAQSFSLMRRDS